MNERLASSKIGRARGPGGGGGDGHGGGNAEGGGGGGGSTDACVVEVEGNITPQLLTLSHATLDP